MHNRLHEHVMNDGSLVRHQSGRAVNGGNIAKGFINLRRQSADRTIHVPYLAHSVWERINRVAGDDLFILHNAHRNHDDATVKRDHLFDIFGRGDRLYRADFRAELLQVRDAGG